MVRMVRKLLLQFIFSTFFAILISLMLSSPALAADYTGNNTNPVTVTNYTTQRTYYFNISINVTSIPIDKIFFEWTETDGTASNTTVANTSNYSRSGVWQNFSVNKTDLAGSNLQYQYKWYFNTTDNTFNTTPKVNYSITLNDTMALTLTSSGGWSVADGSQSVSCSANATHVSISLYRGGILVTTCVSSATCTDTSASIGTTGYICNTTNTNYTSKSDSNSLAVTARGGGGGGGGGGNQPSPVTGIWCGDRKCSGGEDYINCPTDCSKIPSKCGNNVCDVGESPATCPSDCKQVLQTPGISMTPIFVIVGIGAVIYWLAKKRKH